ncbi:MULTISPECIES: acetyl-CoA carboxylase biotin carboxylase subunit [Ligilactobacillus]|jgi:acetyl-CoA carboxylase biotin carboxylase subunit|uniref:Biotin carboxylase n=2 Tax=Ligilactobacillus salivarius TaxID=1624 RepID=Q1WUR7_LIGS1|nr:MULTISPECIES: acetyl-CoA carboxylase biotin carboxylase subunit [Ligilactobacillus]MBN2921784.1 acetyl-CoA carboxylase biotin carboxylase subunit [Lactobacillus sp.]ABD99268.1 Biotin carboxylase [Ligilactobacillus salivarius UCC118]MBL1057892.1 acetyl-CoA carboxylase biotin carboxylase subunit [Ligilactobacillus salivarius]MBL1070870.1 acetyl-CoA carboxylase biotin carboxylase subunit [Ligilactobacillus salivarius]MBM6787021.1 acetyl-CoA carboxylase biotin carboxylase subunit [Ligilactobaci
MFSKVLVANRGEIAVRIIRSLKELGIKSVAIYSTVDRESLHVQLADEAVCVGTARPQDSYLNMKNILAAAIGTGAEAIHPGFGFLSENSQFVEMCEAVGITFIGPNSEIIDLMGNKANAREQMQKSGVPVIPGSEGFIETVEEAKKVANKVGYPVLLKAAAGGGGKGIRKVNDDNELTSLFEEAKREAQVSFGDKRMYLEKIMTNVKHIEVQIFRDKQGNVVYFPERDCSVQRNKQKMIEESPCLLITEEQRKELGNIAIKAANAINYVNTGTIEFLMDSQHNFYFMEMNTRIQVEHTVTEMVTGIDLVKAQVKVASGERLPFNQNDIQINGSAIECRINAEDPSKNFMPQVGKVRYLYFPVGNLGMRIDSDLYAGWEITPFYDSMIAKVISLGQDRHEAIEKVKRLLSEMLITGVKTNQSFYLDILKDKNFLDGKVTTEYLEQNFLPKWKEEHKDAAI